MPAPLSRPIKKLLVANRGEIAIRVFRAASELRIRTVAVYTHEDRYSLHRNKADEAYQLGDNDEPLKPYLDIEEIIALAKRTGVDAIHPGYGFLSENASFAERCAEEGIKFIGPSPHVLRALGDKIAAKEIARLVGVPLIEGGEQGLKSADDALLEAKRIGFPVMLKAAGGGGGRGMRVAREEVDVIQLFAEAQGEAKRAFGDDRIFLERYIEDPKHIEVQLLGDEHGNLLHLFERDCSVQRRFQKVVETAPSKRLSDEQRNRLFDYALRIGREVGLSNAGTVEFLIDKAGEIFFIEVNPRIQVEHTVTEEVTGIDIVRSQILIAEGRQLSDRGIFLKSQDDVTCNGFAIQCRITTEDPENEFRPDYGRIVAYRSPGGFGIRLDAGSAYPGAVIGPFFDSMVVKVTSWGRTLRGASERLTRALEEFRVRGVRTNIPFLINVINHPVFRAGDARVSFLQDHPELFRYQRGQNRANRILKYLAHVIVNGNDDVAGQKVASFPLTPVVPRFKRYAEFPKGSRDRLNELGREKFVKWLRDERRIHYTDTTFRDAHQSLLATRVRTRDMMLVAESFAKHHPEVFSMEVWGGATFDVALRFLHECPWQRLRQLREAIPNILLQMLLRGSNAVGYTAYPDNVVVSFIEQSSRAGIDIFRIFDSLNWLPNMETSIHAVRERTNSLAEVSICYTGDLLDPNQKKYTLQYYLELARRIEDTGAHILAIKDMAGLLKPLAAEKLITELRKAVALPIHLHTHDTSANQSATYLKAVDAEVDVIDVALSSMSGLTSQPNFNSTVEMLKGHLRENPIDTHSLNAFSNYWEAVREYYLPFESGLKAGTAEVYEHEIPGGQYSNLRPQARALGLEDRFEEIKRNFKIVNEMLGDIVKVTPSSKVVGDMALFMTSNNLSVQDIITRGAELSFPESLHSLLRGDLGQPYGGFPANIQDIVLRGEKPITGRLNDNMPAIDLDAGFAAFQEKFSSGCNLDDYHSYLMYPKVFADFERTRKSYGDLSVLPTPAFLYGLQPDDEILVEIEAGKTLLIEYLHTTSANREGVRTVFFFLNGEQRGIEVVDLKIGQHVHVNRKAVGTGEVGAPLQGKISQIMVKKGQTVSQGEPLFLLEAMKMETIVGAPVAGVVQEIHLDAGVLVMPDDLVIIIQ